MKGLDLFSGPGGLTLGLKKAGIQPVASVEIVKDAVDTYSQHTECIHYCGDAKNFNYYEYKGKVDILYGGPPCQPFSTGGLRKLNKDKRDMIPLFIEALSIIKPFCFLMENVPGLITKNSKAYLLSIINRFEEIGYNVDYKVVNSADYGVPQKRKRLLVLGSLGKRLRFPIETHGEDRKVKHRAASTVLSLSAPIGQPPASKVKYAKYPDLRKSPYAGQIYNGGGRPIDMSSPCPTILASSGGYKTHWVDTLNIAPDYHRHLSGGGRPREGYVPGARRLSVEESALIQTFPADLVFSGSRSSQYTQVGDAVPPLLAEAVGRSIVEQVEEQCDHSKLILGENQQVRMIVNA